MQIMKLNTTAASAKTEAASPSGLNMADILQNYMQGPSAADMQDALRRLSANRDEHRMAAANGVQALARLVDVMKHRTGQGYKLRRLLYSLWSGTPCGDLSDVLCLDWPIRIDLCRVLLGWGYEGKSVKLFYSTLETAMAEANLMDWFREANADK
jgi:hypothetical protein